jgi:CheY-like chemotaxis protein
LPPILNLAKPRVIPATKISNSPYFHPYRFCYGFDMVISVKSDESKPKSASGTILLVEHEKQNRDRARICLELQGYTVLDTESPHEAIDLWNNWPEGIQLLITDSGTLGVDGARLAKLLTDENPELKVLFIAENTDGTISEMQRLNHNIHCLRNPYPIKQLAETVNAVLLQA